MDNVTLIRLVSGLLVVLIVIVVPLYALLKRPRKVSREMPGAYPYISGRSADRFVVPRGAVLPSRCVKCGKSPTEPWLQKTFSWHNPALFVLLFVGLLLYVIVVAIVRKTIKLAVPLCDECKASRRRRLRIGTVLLLTCIPAPWVLTYLVKDPDTAMVSAFILGAVMFVAGLIFTLFGFPLQPTHIGRESAEFKGACPDFLAALSTPQTQAFGAGLQS